MGTADERSDGHRRGDGEYDTEETANIPVIVGGFLMLGGAYRFGADTVIVSFYHGRVTEDRKQQTAVAGVNHPSGQTVVQQNREWIPSNIDTLCNEGGYDIHRVTTSRPAPSDTGWNGQPPIRREVLLTL
jgi:hypothetical protein